MTGDVCEWTQDWLGYKADTINFANIENQVFLVHVYLVVLFVVAVGIVKYTTLPNFF